MAIDLTKREGEKNEETVSNLETTSTQGSIHLETIFQALGNRASFLSEPTRSRAPSLFQARRRRESLHASSRDGLATAQPAALAEQVARLVLIDRDKSAGPQVTYMNAVFIDASLKLKLKPAYKEVAVDKYRIYIRTVDGFLCLLSYFLSLDVRVS